ncbi:alpha/beta hydrolase fold protein [Pseudarthrobacter chlorophenolicus A6]|uniref:Alpha/beta hydrolase fold protein n=1 Tax=Pseudarthrobacter chlorophenolicus (strain ATCC 700700 / DSM 12829 / CIP 107037 / JCM 12360 / KCTC 9906 / NCIMB 13794 / A6) TaxID=452863 RepID=B8H8Q5_PSECP|nr:alpha/beta hydrolase [Pseudarthrobacter chlorophenolicus]ACL39933.1 alpha/beta hydrolase fold protein [Pseudarthrobacter chlorophenolicus A6]SDQ91065.1 Lysophospholipase, alpha-beta hydrolase superfamily [Pseudarthrobacter chlorophenolicus]
MAWEEDILGVEFQSLAFRAMGADGVERTATLVRFRPEPDGGAAPRRQRPAVLFLHGWSDYFFNVDLARFWNSAGYDFYALDMHNHGRSLRPDAPGGYVANLADYDAEIEAACVLIGGGAPPPPITLMGHSTGGLVAALWTARNPAFVARLVLNSPWLEMHGSSLVRRAASGLMAPMARLRPEAVLRLPERGFYWRTISSAAEGEWTLDDRYRPPMAFPVRAGWISAVLAGHAQVARGLDIPVPVLVLLSSGSATGLLWSEEMRRRDAVLDVNIIGARALALGRSVTVERIEGALHDVFLSPADVRTDAYARLARWLNAYGAGEPPKPEGPPA